MLINTINEIQDFIKNNKNHNITFSITDDKSPTYDENFIKYYNIKQTEINYGKEKHWMLWDLDLKRIKTLGNFDLIIFIPDDLSNFNFNKIIDFGKKYINDYYVFNILNDGRDFCWNKIPPKKIDNYHSSIGFCDCIFFTNSKTIDKIGYYIERIDPIRFKNNNIISSGVGYQLTNRLNTKGVKIFKPASSLAYHGDHDSVMNYEIRKTQKLISKY